MGVLVGPLGIHVPLLALPLLPPAGPSLQLLVVRQNLFCEQLFAAFWLCLLM